MKLNTEEMSNYEKWCEQWRLKFMNMDQNVLRARLPELTEEGEQLTLYHFSRKFGINKTDGSITVLNGHNPISCYEKLNIYTLLGYAVPFALHKENWVRFDQLKDAAPFSKAFQSGIKKSQTRSA